jgi:hypothetical protein
MTESSQNWILSNISINDTQSIPGLTLDLLYRNLSLTEDEDLGIGYVLYNDQADTVTLIKGHTKGLLLFDLHSAIWIVHSFPNYPPKRKTNKYHINSPQLLHGQSMVCITVKYESLEQIGQQLLYNYPQIYDSFIPDSLLKRNDSILDNIVSVIQGNHVNEAPWFNVNLFETLNKKDKFLSFAKFTSFSDDLYAGLVAQYLKSDLKTETWGSTLPSNCTLDYHVYNIEEISFDSINISFASRHDHSKWAVTDNLQITCMGDINRHIDQYKRAGGTLCLLNNDNIWKQFYSLIKNFDHTCQTRV